MSTRTNKDQQSNWDSYRKALQEKAQEIRRSMSAENIAELVSRVEDPADMGDLSQQSHEEWIFLNKNSLEASLLREVQDALRRLDDRTYGICQECRQPISPKRLEAVPWARYCVRCEERLGKPLEQSEEEE